MLRFAIVLVLAIPIVEMWLMYRLAAAMGFLPAVALVIGTGLAGLAIARRQGMHALTDVRSKMNEGKLPATSMADGALLLVAALLLIVPGVLTDVFGGLLLIPALRKLAIFWALGKFRFGRSVQIIHGAWQYKNRERPATKRSTAQDVVERSLRQNP
ncbi:MAG: hypothetical protein CMJ58_20005 [Planctomycetaceae bacterium]|nr:hypothetical protein [Planctomycetaceae bacterium]